MEGDGLKALLFRQYSDITVTATVANVCSINLCVMLPVVRMRRVSLPPERSLCHSGTGKHLRGGRGGGQGLGIQHKSVWLTIIS